MLLKINNTDYPVKFGYGAFKRLAKLWNAPTFSALSKNFKKLNFKPGTEPTFDQFDLIADLVLVGILNASPNAELNSDDIADFIMNDKSEDLTNVMALFIESMPKELKPKSQGKQTPVKG